MKNIEDFVKSEIEGITNPIVRNALECILVSPKQHLRKWDYGSNDVRFICWTIAVDKESDTAIVYSEYGFGPETPWGLVSESELYFGMDFAWFKTLQECFLDSKMANDLPIWKVEREIDSFNQEVIADNLTLKEAFDNRDSLSLISPNFKYKVSPSVHTT